MRSMCAIGASLLLAGALGGCGDEPCGVSVNPFCEPDGGVRDGGGGTYRLVSGEYAITDLRNKMDGCQIDTDPQNPVEGSKHLLTNDGRGNVTLAGFGMGRVANNAGVLTLSGSTTAGTCTYNYNTRVEMTLTGDNRFTAVLTEDQTNRLSSCIPDVGPSCRTTWIMDLRRDE